MEHINCRSTIGNEKINIERKEFSFLIGKYVSVGMVSYLSIFKIKLFQRVGNVYKIFFSRG